MSFGDAVIPDEWANRLMNKPGNSRLCKAPMAATITGVAKILSGGALFPQKVDDLLFSRRPPIQKRSKSNK